jgi:hypothetical protein
VGTSGGAAVGVVTELVNVETTLSVGVVAGDVPRNGGRGSLVSLLEGDGAGDLGVSADNSNCDDALADFHSSFMSIVSVYLVEICTRRAAGKTRIGSPSR